MRYARASSSLGAKVGGPFDYDAGGPGGWWIVDKLELHFDEGIPVPDLAGWRRERMPDYPDTACVTLVSDRVCEVLSASTRRLDLHFKRPIHAREGGRHLWLVDPTDRTLGAFELREGEWVLIASAKDDDPSGIRPFDAITFSLGTCGRDRGTDAPRTNPGPGTRAPGFAEEYARRAAVADAANREDSDLMNLLDAAATDLAEDLE